MFHSFREQNLVMSETKAVEEREGTSTVSSSVRLLLSTVLDVAERNEQSHWIGSH